MKNFTIAVFIVMGLVVIYLLASIRNNTTARRIDATQPAKQVIQTATDAQPKQNVGHIIEGVPDDLASRIRAEDMANIDKDHQEAFAKFPPHSSSDWASKADSEQIDLEYKSGNALEAKYHLTQAQFEQIGFHLTDAQMDQYLKDHPTSP